MSVAGAGRTRIEIGVVLAHAPLGLVLDRAPVLATVHAALVLLLGLRWAMETRYQHRAFMAAGYIAGAEVLWRMTEFRLFWEYGKYACSLLLVVLLLQYARSVRPMRSAWVFFLLLLPSSVLTYRYFGPSEELREGLSFNLSGSFCLFVSVLAFSGMAMKFSILRSIVVSMLAPLAGVAALTAYGTITAETIYFETESNFTTSGGFGPNQVSAALGLGAVLCLWLALNTNRTLYRLVYAVFAGTFLVQATITLSRGGVVNAVLCMCLLGGHYLRNRRVRIAVIAVLGAMLVLGQSVIVPRLNEWTGGMLEQRYTSIQSEGRVLIAASEMEVFREHPLFGVGPGVLEEMRYNPMWGFGVAAHTEYTRLLAEHGLLGILAMAMIFWMAAVAYVRAPGAMAKGWTAAFVAWPLAEMGHGAMRIAAIGFLFGLAMVVGRHGPDDG